MVPTTLSSLGLAITQSPDDTQSTVGYSGPTDSTSRLPCFKSPEQLSLCENFFASFEKYQKITKSKLCLNLKRLPVPTLNCDQKVTQDSG